MASSRASIPVLRTRSELKGRRRTLGCGLGCGRDRRVKTRRGARQRDIPIPVVLFIDLFVDHFSPPNLPNYTCRDKDVCREHKTADII